VLVADEVSLSFAQCKKNVAFGVVSQHLFSMVIENLKALLSFQCQP
jgi:hypothetical protein